MRVAILKTMDAMGIMGIIVEPVRYERRFCNMIQINMSEKAMTYVMMM
jgi:hypothetical protein